MKGTKEALGEALSVLAQRDTPPFVVTADLAGPLGLEEFEKARPDRFLNVGVAEQAMVGIACGLAHESGAVVATFASFLMRAYEQIRNLVGLDQFNVTLVGSHVGIATGANGATHQSLEDVGAMCALGSIPVLSPAFVEESRRMLLESVDTPGPAYIRLTRWMPDIVGGVPLVNDPVSLLREHASPHVILIGHGCGTRLALLAAQLLDEQGVRCDVVHVAQINPLPDVALSRITTGEAIGIVVEDHYAWSGLGSRIADVAPLWWAAHQGITLGVERLPGSDDAMDLLTEAGLDPQAIAVTVLNRLRQVGG